MLSLLCFLIVLFLSLFSPPSPFFPSSLLILLIFPTDLSVTLSVFVSFVSVFFFFPDSLRRPLSRSSYAAGLKWSFMQVSHGGSYTLQNISLDTNVTQTPASHFAQKPHTHAVAQIHTPRAHTCKHFGIRGETLYVHNPLYFIGHRCMSL